MCSPPQAAPLVDVFTFDLLSTWVLSHCWLFISDTPSRSALARSEVIDCMCEVGVWRAHPPSVGSSHRLLMRVWLELALILLFHVLTCIYGLHISLSQAWQTGSGGGVKLEGRWRTFGHKQIIWKKQLSNMLLTVWCHFVGHGQISTLASFVPLYVYFTALLISGAENFVGCLSPGTVLYNSTWKVTVSTITT